MKNKKVNENIKPKKSKIKIFGLIFSILLITGIISGIIDKKDTSIQWTSKIDNSIWNYQYNVVDKVNTISNVIFNSKTEEEFILITNKNSKDKIKINPLYSNSLSNIANNMARIYDGKIIKKYNGYNIYDMKNNKNKLIYVYPQICYIEYSKKDGRLEDIFINISKSITGGSL